MSSFKITPKDVDIVLSYLEWSDAYKNEKPFQVLCAEIPDDPSVRTTNLVFVDGEPERMHDCRGRESDFSIEKQGFAFVNHHSAISDINNMTLDQIENDYIPEMEALIRREIDDVERVYFFDWRMRQNLEIETERVNLGDKMQVLKPASHVHIDQSPAAVVGRVLLHLPDEAQNLLQGRVRVINTWQPLVDKIEDCHLCLCDARAVDPGDMVEADHVRKHYQGATMYAKWRKDHYVWYYLNEQTNKEVTLISMFDSHSGGRQSQTPHSSFQVKDPPEGVSPRKSIEARALIFSKVPEQ